MDAQLLGKELRLFHREDVPSCSQHDLRLCSSQTQRKYPFPTAGEIIAKEGNAYVVKKNDIEVRGSYILCYN